MLHIEPTRFDTHVLPLLDHKTTLMVEDIELEMLAHEEGRSRELGEHIQDMQGNRHDATVEGTRASLET